MQRSNSDNDTRESRESPSPPQEAPQPSASRLDTNDLSDAVSETQQTLIHGVDRTADRIRRKPWQSMAIAAGLGALFGLLIRKR